MVAVLRNSLPITTLGYTFQHNPCSSGSHECKAHYPYALCCAYLSSDIKPNRRRAKSYGLKMWSISMEGHAISGVPKLVFPEKGLGFGPIGSDNSLVVEFESVCEEENELVRSEKKDAEVNQLEQKLPPWGTSSNQMDSGFVTSGANKSSTISKSTVGGNDNRIHFLEERNEGILSERILNLSRSNKVRSAMELYRSMEYSGLRPTLHACNSLISCLLRKGKVEDTLRMFKLMKTNETISGHTCSLVLKAIANARGCDEALKIFEEFEMDGSVRKYFDVVVYNTMISVCGKVNNWVQTLRIWRSMKDNGLTGTAVTYRLLVCIFVRCGQNELAIDAYLEMVQSRLNPSDDEMQAIIGACSKEGKWDLALHVFGNMLKRGLKPSLVTCNALINTLGKDGKVKQAFRIYSLLKSFGHSPDTYTWNALIGALYRANRHGDALLLFESIKKDKTSPPNLHMYNTCLMCCQKLGLWDKGLQLLWQMESSGIPISTPTYNLVIGACEVARKPKIALQVYEHMVHQKCAPDTFTLLSLIRGCIWGSLWYEVEEMLNQVTPDSSLYNAAIQGMCLRGKIDLAKKLYAKMRMKSLKPDGKTRALMLQSLQKHSVRRKRRWFSYLREILNSLLISTTNFFSFSVALGNKY